MLTHTHMCARTHTVKGTNTNTYSYADSHNTAAQEHSDSCTRLGETS